MRNILNQTKKIHLTGKIPKNLPEKPGVYFFWEKEKPIYIGKAKNLKNRLASYFLQNLAPKTKHMVKIADSLSYITVESELDSLLLEAKLIRTCMPKYNSASKDDKHPLYIAITKDEFPQVISCRKLLASSYKYTFGPFPSSGNVHSVLRMIRGIFPFSDHKIEKRACIYNHIGLCDPCPSIVNKISDPELKNKEKKRYLKNIRRINGVLSGRVKNIRTELLREMDNFSKIQNYEEALLIRDQIQRLDYITQPIIPSEYFLENPNLREDLRTQELLDLKKILTNYNLRISDLTRIECYDIAHLAGSNPAASMVTFINGEPDKSLYRHFKIYQIKGNSDTDSMTEVAKRRIKYLKTWGTPDLIIVDGGKPQVSVFKAALSLNEIAKDIPIIGIAKSFETLVIPSDKSYKQIKLPQGNALRLVQRIRDEAHRFARRYHFNLLKKNLLYN